MTTVHLKLDTWTEDLKSTNLYYYKNCLPRKSPIKKNQCSSELYSRRNSRVYKMQGRSNLFH